MFKKWFGPKPKPTPLPEVELPVQIGQTIRLANHISFYIESIGEKDKDSNTWQASGKAIVSLPGPADNIHVQPMVTGEYRSLKYFVTYNLPNRNADLVKVYSEWERTFTDKYDRKLLIKMDVTEVGTE